MLNQAQLIGRVGKDPETKYTGSGRAVTNFSVATESTWKNQAGEKQSKTEWHRCTAWGKLAEIIQQYVKKGQLLFVQGRIETRKWEDRDKITRYSTDIVVDTMKMLGGKPGGASSAPVSETPADDFEQPGGERTSSASAPPSSPDFTEDDLPF